MSLDARSSPALPTATVLNLYGTGLGIARALGRHGIPVVGVSNSAHAPGASTRYATHLVGPDSESDPEGLRDFLLERVPEERERGVLYPTRDQDVLFLDAHRGALETRFAIPQPSGVALAGIMDKARLASLAAACGVETPRTERVSTPEDVERVGHGFPYPAVLKPLRAVDWRRPGVWDAVGRRKGMRVDTFDALRRGYERVAPHAPDAIVQEWIPGAGDQFFVLGAYIDRTGRVAGTFTAQKMLQYPPDFGLGCIVRAIQAPDVERIGCALLEALSFRGVAEVEFKRDVRTGRYRLIEINPRHWDQHMLGVTQGVNLPLLVYEDMTGHTVVRPAPRGGRGTWLDERGLAGSLRSELSRFRFGALGALVRTLFTHRIYTLWAADDPRPFLTAFTPGTRRGA